MSKFIIVLISLLVSITPALAQDLVPDTNLTDSCVTDYDPNVDYFPEKVEITDAAGFDVSYFNHYKVVTVTDAFDNAPVYDYVLVQCGTPAPDAADFAEGTQFIEVPAGNLIALSTTQIPHLIELDLLDQLVGMDSFDFVGNPQVRALIDAGELVAVGYGSTISIEAVLDSDAEIVMTYGYDPATDAHPVLIDAGIFTALNSEYREATPLGRAEWIKFTGLFYNAEAEANAAYDEISTAYNSARELAASIPAEERPTVLWNVFSAWTESWIIPGAQTYAGNLLLDAGANIALGELAPDDSAQFSFEVVYDGALDADIWVTTTQDVNTPDELFALDSRYADFAAAQSGALWSNDLSMNAVGGNNYWEVGVAYPHLLLQDLIAIFHPELLPDHEFTFFRPITGE